ncbi:MAG: response regulator [Planctomycetota bacterium]
MKALIVEDERDLREFFRRVVSAAGFETQTAENGQEGLRLYQDFRPELVLCDIRMPVMNGLELVRAIRGHGSDSIVVMVTGHQGEDYVIEALRAGANNYLKKPAGIADLRPMVEKYADLIQNRGTRKELLDMTVKRQITMQFESRIDLIARVADHLTQECVGVFSEQECLSVHLGIYELLVNAVEHGNLEIAYKEKSEALRAGMLDYLYNERQATPELASRKVTVDFFLDETGCEWLISDEGQGFDWRSLPDAIEEEGFLRPHGRGILISRFVFDEVEFMGKGNIVRVRKNSTPTKGAGPGKSQEIL